MKKEQSCENFFSQSKPELKLMRTNNKTKELTKSYQKKTRSILSKVQLKIPDGGLNIAFGMRGMTTVSYCWRR